MRSSTHYGHVAALKKNLSRSVGSTNVFVVEGSDYSTGKSVRRLAKGYKKARGASVGIFLTRRPGLDGNREQDLFTAHSDCAAPNDTFLAELSCACVCSSCRLGNEFHNISLL